MFSFGFYDSLNGDRKYNARQMSEIFDGIINDGVYASIGKLFSVRPGDGLSVIVGSGRAWFNHTWNKNDTDLRLAIQPADVLLPRYDAVVLTVDRRTSKRQNSLAIVTGTPASNPAKPILLNGQDDVWQHPLAYVRVNAKATSIAKSQIQNAVGTSACPFVTGIIETADIDVLFQQWEGEFTDWFENVQAQLTNNVVTNLQYQIDHCVKVANKATQTDVNNGTKNKWVPSDVLKTSIDTVNGTINTLRTNTNNQINTLRTNTNDQITTLSERIGTGGKSCRVVSGSYVGQRTSGAGIKKTLVLGIYPLVLWILPVVTNSGSVDYSYMNYCIPIMLCRPANSFFLDSYGGNGDTPVYKLNRCIWGNDRVTFPDTTNYLYALNEANRTYHYIAIGYDLSST